jgi:hypothetical protein
VARYKFHNSGTNLQEYYVPAGSLDMIYHSFVDLLGEGNLQQDAYVGHVHECSSSPTETDE